MTERQTKISQLLQTTTVLSVEEKEEWRQLLPLMNDKQLSDLEDLLHVPAKEDVRPVQKSAPPKMVSTPIPMDTSYINTDPRVEKKMTPEAVMPVMPEPVKTVEPVKAAPVQSVIQEPQPVKQQQPSHDITESVLLYKKPEQKSPVATGSTPVGGGLPSTANDVMALGVLIVKAQNFPAIVQRLKQLASVWGYYNLYLLLQKSPLYTAYLEYGSSLADRKTTTALSADDFDAIADMLITLKNA